MNKKIQIALASGSEELNEAIISVTNNNYEYTQIHYREFFIEKEMNKEFDICIISKLLTGEKDFDKLIFFLKSKNIRVIMILLNEDKEEFETCIKYQITDVLTQPVKPIDILNIIENPKTFKDIDFIYKKLGLEFEIQGTKQKKTRRSFTNMIFRKKPISKKNEQQKLTDIKTEHNRPAESNIENQVNVAGLISKNKGSEIQKEYRLVRAKKVSFVNLSEGAGSTFLTLNTAYSIMNDFGVKPSVIELPDSNSIIFYQIADEEDYIPLAWKIENNEKDYEKSVYNKDGITFYINKGKYNYSSWNTDKNIRFINIATNKADINLFDVGNSTDDYIMKSSDKIFVIVDPIPYKLLNVMNNLQKIKMITAEYAINTIYVFNKWIDKLDRKDIEKYLQIKNSICVHYVSPEIYYKAAYNNQVAYQIKEGKNTLEEGLKEIINEIIPYGTKKRKKFLELR